MGKIKILDLSSGNRAIWLNKNHPLTTYLDKRPEVNPTFVCNTNKIPDEVGSGFNLIVWDPPHMNCGPNSNMSRRYGYHKTAEILETIKLTGLEAHRISAKNAVMAFKWNDHDIKLKKVYELLPTWEPLFGHLVKNGVHSQTYWVLFLRLDI